MRVRSPWGPGIRGGIARFRRSDSSRVSIDCAAVASSTLSVAFDFCCRQILDPTALEHFRHSAIWLGRLHSLSADRRFENPAHEPTCRSWRLPSPLPPSTSRRLSPQNGTLRLHPTKFTPQPWRGSPQNRFCVRKSYSYLPAASNRRKISTPNARHILDPLPL